MLYWFVKYGVAGAILAGVVLFVGYVLRPAIEHGLDALPADVTAGIGVVAILAAFSTIAYFIGYDRGRSERD